MIPNRPLNLDERVRLSYWKTVCRECFGWSDSQTEAWVDKDVPDFDYDLPGTLQYHYDPVKEICRLFVPEHLRERFRKGTLTGLNEFFTGLEEVLSLGDQLYEGFPADFDWRLARVRIRRLTSEFTLKNVAYAG